MVTKDKLANCRDVDSKELERSISIIELELALVSEIQESTCASVVVLKNVDMRRTLSTLLLKLLPVPLSISLQVSLLLIVSSELTALSCTI